MPKADVVIIGSGLAALVTASRLCMKKNVIIFTKATICNSNSMLAQGGVAASISADDHWTSHYNDTLTAGCHHNNKQAVQKLVKAGPSYMLNLIEQGMRFDQDKVGGILLGQEGAHSHRRILHAGGDATGKALVAFLLQKIRGKVTIIEHEMAVDLIMLEGRCIGVKSLTASECVNYYFAKFIVLATGGCGGLFEFTSNDPSVIGDGYAMAYRAGADLVDMEFVQFHPTLLYSNGECPGLISEAVRGEGAILITEAGRRIMKNKHPLKDLAPRDIVSRTIYEEIQMGEKVYLDISMIREFSARFPTITKLCEDHNIKFTEGKIPVVPGAHFMMGGIKVNKYSESSVRGLFAVGEVACTGVHGANRLASNSLLEGIVYANQLADYILCKEESLITIPEGMEEQLINLTTVEKLPTIQQIKNMVMNTIGIVRNKKDLEKAIQYFEPYLQLTPLQIGYTKESITILNMITTAWLIASSALKREESRGGHFRSDFMKTKKEWNQKEIVRKFSEHAYI